MRIEAVIFDLGGVILDIDYAATVRALQLLLGRDCYAPAEPLPFFDDFETGHVDSEGFYESLARLAGRPLEPAAIDAAWNAMLGRIRPERIEFLRRVGQRRRLFLLSNTNSIHKAAVQPALQEHMTGQPFDSLFEAAYYSHEIGLRKPHAEVFRFVLDRHRLMAETTLFIDDNRANIEGARQLGLEVHHLQGELLESPVSTRLLSP